jgi:hypothetical protein
MRNTLALPLKHSRLNEKLGSQNGFPPRIDIRLILSGAT